jgi:hypothetical protein
MSGTGQSNTQAPTRLTPIVLDQPIVDARTGQPTPYFGQMIQRILSYLGQPATSSSGGGGSGSGLTITEQITNLNTQVEVLQAQAAGNTPQSGTISRLSSLEVAFRNLLRFNRPPPSAALRILVPAAPPPPPNLTPAMILSWWNQ